MQPVRQVLCNTTELFATVLCGTYMYILYKADTMPLILGLGTLSLLAYVRLFFCNFIDDSTILRPSVYTL